MVVGSAAFVVAEEEDGIRPLRTRHESIHDARHFHLPKENRLTRPRMLVISAVTGLNECKAGQRTVGEIAEVGLYRGNVSRVNAEGVVLVVDRNLGALRGSDTGSAGWILIKIIYRIVQAGEVGRGIRRAPRATAVIVSYQAEALGDRVVDLPGDFCLVKFRENIRYIELGKMVIASWILYQALSRASGEGSDAIVNALARDRREPAIGYRELRCHVVVVIEKPLVVIAHGALTGRICVLAGTTASRGRATQIVAFGGVDETILQDWTWCGCDGKIVAIDVSVARQPIRTIVVDASAFKLEERIG